ncbi:MAG TPA: hypothetical protein VL307_07275 [Chitinophagaceae bacterium]|nr:hypothetical protein [Chitinophagaceae bacterium]
MSDNQSPLNYTATDIEKYWRGELSPTAQHAIEKAALDDPFLADALEGYAQRAKENNQISADLSALEERLSARVHQPADKHVIAFQWWKIAAFIIVLLGAGWFFLLMNKPRNATAIVKNTQPAPSTASSPAQDSPLLNPAATDSTHDLAFEKNAAPPKQLPAANPAGDELPTAAPRALRSKKDGLQAAPPQVSENEKTEEPAVATLSKKESANADRLEINTEKPAAVASAENRERQANAYSPAAANMFNGQLRDQSNKPLANAVIQIPQLNVATQTDEKGNFAFKARDTAIKASLSSDGFMKQNIYLSNKATLNQIVLQPVPEKDREVVVQSNGAEKKRKSAVQELTIIIPDAEPVIGWEAFREYLQKNKKIPAELKDLHGNVVVSFEVHARWFGNYTIEESLDDELDAEAIRLVKQGPAWKLLKGKKAKATVIVKF